MAGNREKYLKNIRFLSKKPDLLYTISPRYWQREEDNGSVRIFRMKKGQLPSERCWEGRIRALWGHQGATAALLPSASHSGHAQPQHSSYLRLEHLGDTAEEMSNKHINDTIINQLISSCRLHCFPCLKGKTLLSTQANIPAHLAARES